MNDISYAKDLNNYKKELNSYKRSAIEAAKDFRYGTDIIAAIKKAHSESEITIIMNKARKERYHDYSDECSQEYYDKHLRDY